MQWMTKNKWIVMGLMLVHFIVCFLYIDSFPIALDEPFSIFHSQKSLPDLWEVFKNENNPPLHFILLHFWIKWFGTTAMAVRSLSLVFSVLTIPALFKLGKKITGTHGGILLVGFFIFSNFHHYHAVEARVYSLFVCLFAWIALDLYQVIFEQRKRSIWRLLIWNTALLYSHYLAGFVIACEAVVLIYFYKHLIKKDWINLFISGALSVVLFIPGLRLWLMRYDAFAENTTWVPDPHWTELYGNIVRFMNGKLTYLLIGILLIMLFFIRWNTLRNHWKMLITPKNQFVLLFFILTYGGMFLVSILFKPVFLDRYLLYTSILVFLLYVVVVEFLLHQKQDYIALLLLVPMIAFFDWQPKNNREPDQMANWIERGAGEQSVLICPPFYDLTFIYHHQPEIFTNPMQKEKLMEEASIYRLYNGSELKTVALKDTVYFVDANSKFLYPNNGIQEALKAEYNMIKSEEFKGDFSVSQFIRK